MVWLTEHEPVACIVISPHFYLQLSVSPVNAERGNQTIRKSENRAAGAGGAGAGGGEGGVSAVYNGTITLDKLVAA